MRKVFIKLEVLKSKNHISTINRVAQGTRTQGWAKKFRGYEGYFVGESGGSERKNTKKFQNFHKTLKKLQFFWENLKIVDKSLDFIERHYIFVKYSEKNLNKQSNTASYERE